MSNLNLRANRVGINFNGLIKLMKEYYKSLDDNAIIINTLNDNFADAIIKLKRDVSTPIGPYVNITPFEAMNRIASDLVTLNGIYQLLEIDKIVSKKNCEMTIYLGNEDSPTGDFIINGKHGEAFNVATSFFSGKISQTKRKWIQKNENLDYILYNGDLGEKTISNIKGFSPKLIPVREWDRKQFK